MSTATSPAGRLGKRLLYGDGPLSEWRGAPGVVRSYISRICTGAEDLDLSEGELVLVLLRRLRELADALAHARQVIEDVATDDPLL